MDDNSPTDNVVDTIAMLGGQQTDLCIHPWWRGTSHVWNQQCDARFVGIVFFSKYSLKRSVHRGTSLYQIADGTARTVILLSITGVVACIMNIFNFLVTSYTGPLVLQILGNVGLRHHNCHVIVVRNNRILVTSYWVLVLKWFFLCRWKSLFRSHCHHLSSVIIFRWNNG